MVVAITSATIAIVKYINALMVFLLQVHLPALCRARNKLSLNNDDNAPFSLRK